MCFLQYIPQNPGEESNGFFACLSNPFLCTRSYNSSSEPQRFETKARSLRVASETVVLSTNTQSPLGDFNSRLLLDAAPALQVQSDYNTSHSIWNSTRTEDPSSSSSSIFLSTKFSEGVSIESLETFNKQELGMSRSYSSFHEGLSLPLRPFAKKKVKFLERTRLSGNA